VDSKLKVVFASLLAVVVIVSGAAVVLNARGTDLGRFSDLATFGDAPATPDDQSGEPVAEPKLPAQLLDLSNWKLTLPVGKEQDEADEVEQPKLAHFQDPKFFHLNDAGDGVVFRANAGGATTSGSGYPRSELREMKKNGKDEADWSNKSGIHTMTIVQAITATPKVKPEVAAGQIHGEEDVVAMVRLEKKHLFVESDGDEVGDLDNDYKLGTKFTLVMRATPGGVTVTYNDKKTVKIDEVGGGNYFKAGCYTQASDHRQEDDDPDQKYDKPDAYGEVVIYSLKVEHKN
jgi:poly(beta-D-mannuronate) lyase